MGWIYKVTNQINGKMYIGKTEYADPLDRWKEHKHDYLRKRCEKRPFYDALKKYGVDNFKFEVIDCDDDSERLCNLEKYYIDKYRTYVGFSDCNGYNATLGGDGKSYLRLNEDEVVQVHIYNQFRLGETAKYFGVDPGTIKKILIRHNITWLSKEEIIRIDFVRKYGGLVQLNNSCSEILNIYETPFDAYSGSSDFQLKSLKDVYRTNHKTHKYKGFVWYRLNELPEEYLPLLKEYCGLHLDADNLEIDDSMLCL